MSGLGRRCYLVEIFRKFSVSIEMNQSFLPIKDVSRVNFK